MTDKMVDVSGRRRPAWPTLADDTVGHQADVGRRHFFFQFADTHTNVVRRRRPECRQVSASVVRRRRPSSPTLRPTSAADVGPSVGECRRVSSADIVGPVFRQSGRRRRTTLADTRQHSRRRRRECRPAWPTSAADISVSVRKLDRQCRWPTLADT